MSGEFAGTLRERVTIEVLAPDRDEGGAPSGAWTGAELAWAAIEPIAPGPQEAGEALAAMPRWRVTLRARAIGLEHRLSWKGRRLAVRAVGFDPRRAGRVTLVCEEERA